MTMVSVDLDLVVDPVAVFWALWSSGDDAFWLDNGSRGGSYLGRGMRIPLGPKPIVAIKDAIEGLDHPSGDTSDQGLGLLGWFDYSLGTQTAGVRLNSTAGQETRFIRVDEVLVVDLRGNARLVMRTESSRRASNHTRAERAREWLTSLPPAKADTDASVQNYTEGRPEVSWRDSTDEYRRMIRTCQDHIAAGDVYQLCLTTQAAVLGAIDSYTTFLALRRENRRHRSAFIRIGETAVLSISPEQFLSINPERTVSTSPIKGTRPRAEDPGVDQELRRQLLDSDKERAENVMIVDLMRNDLGRVCEVGSVKTSRLLDVYSYPQVHQLVSTIEGRHRPELDAMDVVSACFPAGSMTGAPRIRAMELLSRIETGPRGAYAGAYGFLGFDGSADLSMTIRTIVSTPRGATIGIGGGITTLSDPDQEAQELQWKAAALLRSIRAPGW